MTMHREHTGMSILRIRFACIVITFETIMDVKNPSTRQESCVYAFLGDHKSLPVLVPIIVIA